MSQISVERLEDHWSSGLLSSHFYWCIFFAWENQQFDFSTRSDTNWPVHSQKQARGLSFKFEKSMDCTVRVDKPNALISFAVTE